MHNKFLNEIQTIIENLQKENKRLTELSNTRFDEIQFYKDLYQKERSKNIMNYRIVRNVKKYINNAIKYKNINGDLKIYLQEIESSLNEVKYTT